MHSSHIQRKGARPLVARHILGRANIDVTQNCLRHPNRRRTNAAQNAEKEEKESA